MPRPFCVAIYAWGSQNLVRRLACATGFQTKQKGKREKMAFTLTLRASSESASYYCDSNFVQVTDFESGPN